MQKTNLMFGGFDMGADVSYITFSFVIGQNVNPNTIGEFDV
jgi:hypothetical protein